MLLALLQMGWSALTIFLALALWKEARKHQDTPALQYSSRDQFSSGFFNRFLRRMVLFTSVLLIGSAWAVWHSWFLALVLLAAVPALVTVQVVRSKSAIGNSYRRSLPPS
jgi:ABC-type transport system involved in cytochrome bd biosynthesis fused ATPase/permease subunit